jgi:glycine betaine/choline ABC-type transport system substrate-binding protein
MLDKLSDRFVLIRTKTRVFAVTFVVLFALTAFIPLRGQSQQNSSIVAGGSQDTNSAALNSMVTQEAATTDAVEQLTMEKLQAKKKQQPNRRS